MELSGDNCELHSGVTFRDAHMIDVASCFDHVFVGSRDSDREAVFAIPTYRSKAPVW